MEKRVVLFLVLSLGIIFAYDFLLKQLGITPLSPPSTLEREIDPVDSHQDSSEIAEKPPSEMPFVEESPNGVSSPSPSEVQEDVVIETPLFRTGLASKGGVITFWELKKYLTQTEDPQPVELMYSKGQFSGPLSLRVTGNQALTDQIQKGPFAIQKTFSQLDASRPTGKVILRFEDPSSDLWIEKELTFHFDSYVVDVEIRTQGLAESLEVILGTNFGVVEWGQGFIGLLGSAWMIGEELEKENPDKMGETLHRQGDVKWLALQDKYFLSVLIPEQSSEIFATLETEHVVTAGIGFPSGNDGQTHKVRLYAGPKHYDTLKNFGIGLEDTIDFGWFIYGSWTIVK
jgi:YidC/Oxa1 family membrane protein insertase